MKKFKEAHGYAADLQAAYDYYSRYGGATAGRFLAAYLSALRVIKYHPYVCRIRMHGWRQMIIKDYPAYSIFYREMESCWLIGGLVGTLQDPDYIQASLLIREIREPKHD